MLEDRDKYGWANAVFKPARMTAQELEQGVQETYENLFHFFKRRAPKQILKWLPFFVRHPRILAARLASPAPPGQDRQKLRGNLWR